MSKQILVIEDDEEILDFVQAALEQDGYLVQASRTGICLPQGRGPAPDLILLDVLVSPAVGSAFLQQRQERASTHTIPFLLFSAQVTTSQILQGSALALFPARPCSIRILLDIVWKSLSASRLPPTIPG
jgi:DNA-binding response OmpR family regulator